MASALLVVGNVTLSTGDQMISDLLDGTEAASSRSDTVEVRSHSNPPANFDSYDYIVVSETVSSGTFWTSYSALGTEAKPVWCLENGNFDEFRLATSAGNTTSMSVHAVFPEHYLHAGIAENTNVTVSTGNEGAQAGSAALGAGAIKPWSKAADETNWGIFGYETAASMTSGTAPARRLAWGFKDSAIALLTADGKTIFLASVEWINGEDAGGAVSGTSAATQADQTSTASGTVVPPPISGTSAPTQADQTSTASGTFTAAGVTGTLAVTQDAQTSTASGTLGATFPDAPPNVTAVAQSDTEILVSWDAVSGADAYDVERDSVVVGDKVAALSFSDTGLAASTQYSYRVRAARTP